MGRVGWVAIGWEDADPRYLHETGEGSVSRQNRMLALCSFSGCPLFSARPSQPVVSYCDLSHCLMNEQ